MPIVANVDDCAGNRGNRNWRERWFIDGVVEQIEGNWLASSTCERQPFDFLPTFDQVGTYTVTFQSQYRSQVGPFVGDPDTDQQASIDIVVDDAEPIVLSFDQQPLDTREDELISPAVTVRVEDGDGNLVDDADDDITLSIAENPGGGVLSGTTTVSAQDGIATFDDLSIDQQGEGYTLEATADDSVPAESDPFDIVDANLVRISGRVDELGSGREGVNILAGGGNDTVTGGDGSYRLFVDPNSTVTLETNHADLIFCPPQRTVSVGDTDQPGIGFQAFPDGDGPATAGAGGDSIFTDGDDVVHVFCSTGSTQFEPPANTDEVEVLVVGGGGGGGAPLHFTSAGGGGGGAGGVVQRDAYAVDGTVDVTVGAGGAPGDTPNTPSKGDDGDDSVFDGLIAIGGGGGSGNNESGNDGGSGGGSRGSPGSTGLQPGSGSGGFGNDGGAHPTTGRDPSIHRAAGGGGGAGEAGQDLAGDPGEDGGDGGDGLAFATVGASVTYAGGGGGGAADFGNNDPGDPGAGGVGGGGRGGRTGVTPVPGFPATGGGGGGGNNAVAGAEGGSGIVVVRYPRPAPVLTCRARDFESDLGPEWDTESISGGFGEPRAIDGALRLTDESNNVSTRATILNELPWNGNRVEVTFRYFAYGGSGADGIAVVFSDAGVDPSPGGFGGSLGYAQRNGVDGFAGGWIGIGLDEFGNYSNPTEGREGGPGSTPNAIAIRGDGAGEDGYEYLAGTDSLSPQLWDPGADSRADMTGDVFRITVDTTEPEVWLVRIERDTSGTGDNFTTVLETDVFGRQATDPPEEVFLSFTGSTGGSTNIHEMDFLEVCANRGIEVDDEVSRYEVSHAGQGLTCIAEPVTITALDSDGNPVAPADGTILDLSATTDSGDDEGDWVRLVSGGGAFSAGGIGSGAGAYTFPGEESQAIIAYQYAQLQNDPENVVLSVNDGEASGSSDDPLSVSLAGFRFVNETDGTTTIPDQIAGKPSDILYNAASLGLQAIRASDEDPTMCEGQFGAGETTTIELAAECRDPDQCAGQALAVGGAEVATSDDNGDTGAAAAYSAVDLTFDANSTAPLVLRYPDAGRTRLYARYEIPLAEDPGDPEAGAPSGGFMRGASNEFVWRPYGFDVEVETTEADQVSPMGDVFRVAGEPFPVRLRAVAWDNGQGFDGAQPAADTDLADNVSTPNFGNEVDNPRATIEQTVAAPAPVDGGVDGVLENAVYDAFGAEDAGEQEREDVSWNEVGYVNLDAELDGDYLGTEPITGRAENVGRFIPDDFSVSPGSLQDRAALPACSGDFTYIGERFDVDFTVTARNIGGSRTRNYTDTYARLTSGQLGMGATDSAEDLTGDLNVDSRSLVWNQGQGDADLELSLARGTPDGPFAALKVGTNPADSDGVDLADPDLALDGGGTTHAEVGETELRFGRLVIDNALGSEQGSLTLPLRAEYWDGSTWVVNADDACTPVTLADHILLTSSGGADDVAGDQTVPLDSGETRLTDGTDDPLTLDDGAAGFVFTAPGAGNIGWVDLRVDLASAGLTFLGDDLADDGDYNEAPRGRASFGLFGGNPNQIYREEVLR